jgi:hypothetical protein
MEAASSPVIRISFSLHLSNTQIAKKDTVYILPIGNAQIICNKDLLIPVKNKKSFGNVIAKP